MRAGAQSCVDSCDDAMASSNLPLRRECFNAVSSEVASELFGEDTVLAGVTQEEDWWRHVVAWIKK